MLFRSGARISRSLSPRECVPAPGQGIIAIEIRAGDAPTGEVVRRISDAAAGAALSAQRALVTELGGGCQMPIGAYADISQDRLRLTALLISLDGQQEARAEVQGAITEAAKIGEQAAAQILLSGGRDILSEIAFARASIEGTQP